MQRFPKETSIGVKKCLGTKPELTLEMEALELCGCTQATRACTPTQALSWRASEWRAEAGQHTLPTPSTKISSPCCDAFLSFRYTHLAGVR